jgi:hypothetical protein
MTEPTAVTLNVSTYVKLGLADKTVESEPVSYYSANSEALNDGLSVGDFYLDGGGKLQVVRPLNLSFSLSNRYSHLLRLF